MQPENPTPKPRRSLFGCVFSGTLGCGAFLFGAVVSVALFAPTMLGDVVARGLQAEFHQNHDGRLMIEDLQLSWADRQRASGVKVLDLDGEEVVVLNARFPSLLTMLGVQGGSRDFEVEILRARLEIDADGVSNVARAMADRGRPFEWIESVDARLIRERPTDWQGSDFSSGEWAWSSLVVRAASGVVSIRDTRQALDPVSIEELDLSILAGPAGDTRSEDRAIVRGTVRFSEDGQCRLDLSRPLSSLDWSGLVEGDQIPTRLVGTLLGDGGKLDTLLGPTCDGSLRFARLAGQQAGATRIEGDLSSAPTRIEWSFVVDGDAVSSAGDEVALRLVSTERGVFTSETTHWLLPWLARDGTGPGTTPPQGPRAPGAAAGPGGMEIDLDGLSFSRDAGLPSLAGRARLRLLQRAHTPIRAFADTLGLAEGLSFELDTSVPIELGVEAGVVRYDGIAMTIDGKRCTFQGTHELEDGRIEIEIEVPLSFVARRMLKPGTLDELVAPALTVPVRLVGTWRDPTLNVNLRVLQEAMSLNFKSKAQGVFSDTLRALVPSDD